jgi:hypothetical protein
MVVTSAGGNDGEESMAQGQEMSVESREYQGRMVIWRGMGFVLMAFGP